MAALRTNQTTNTTGTGASHSGPCTVFVRGVLGGANVQIQVADEDVSASYVNADVVSVPNASEFRATGAVSLNCFGTYFVRAILSKAGSSTSVSVVTTQ